MSSSERVDSWRWMLETGRPGTTKLAAQDEPMNCSRRGMDVSGRDGSEAGERMVESSSSSRRAGVRWRKRATLSSRGKVAVKCTRCVGAALRKTQEAEGSRWRWSEWRSDMLWSASTRSV